MGKLKYAYTITYRATVRRKRSHIQTKIWVNWEQIQYWNLDSEDQSPCPQMCLFPRPPHPAAFSGALPGGLLLKEGWWSAPPILGGPTSLAVADWIQSQHLTHEQPVRFFPLCWLQTKTAQSLEPVVPEVMRKQRRPLAENEKIPWKQDCMGREWAIPEAIICPIVFQLQVMDSLWITHLPF